MRETFGAQAGLLKKFAGGVVIVIIIGGERVIIYSGTSLLMSLSVSGVERRSHVPKVVHLQPCCDDGELRG